MLLQPRNGLQMRVAEKVQRHRRAILVATTVLMFGTLLLYAFTERERDISATVEAAAAEGTSYLLERLNDRLLTIAGLSVSFVLLLSIILAQMLEGNRRKRAEEALRESEEKYRAIFDGSRDGIVLVDRSSGGIVECNREFEVQTGRTLDQLRLMKIWDVRPEDMVEAARQKFQDIAGDGGGGSAELDFRKPDGQTIPVEFVSRSVEIGGRQYLQSMVRDVAERRLAEEELLRLSSVVNATNDGVTVTDLAGTITDCNRAWLEMTGYEKEEVIGKASAELCTAEEDLPRLLEAMTVLLSGRPVGPSEYVTVCRDGTRLTASVALSLLKNQQGEPYAVASVIRDVTELRKAQDQLQHSHLLSSLGEMTAGIAHEVNNPLGSVLLYSELLMAGNVATQTRKDLKVIHDEAKRAARIMTDLLTYSRKVKYQVRRLDLHRILSKLLEMRRYTERVHNIAVATDFAEGPLWVRGDSSHLKQLFMHLMLNAEEAVKDGGGGHIEVTTRRDGEWARISVSDDGGGIPPEHLRQVFYPFFTTKDVGDGTGLGLSTCYGIVTNHNGLIRAENNDAGGAAFIVELPLAKDQKRRAPVPANREAGPAVASGRETTPEVEPCPSR